MALSVWAFTKSIVPFWEQSENLEAETKAFGIVVRGYAVLGCVQNTNPFPVRIRSTWVFHGERYRWIAVLQPGETMLDVPGIRVLYHIYRLDDSEEMGIVHAAPNGPVGPKYRNPFVHNPPQSEIKGFARCLMLDMETPVATPNPRIN